MADVWGEVKAQPVYQARDRKPVDWFLRVLWLGVLFLLAKFALEYVFTGVFVSWQALVLLVFFLILPYFIWVLRGNAGWDSVVQKLFIAYCTYLVFAFVVFIAVLLA